MKAKKAIAIILTILTFAVTLSAADWMAPSKAGKKGNLVGGKTKWTYHEVDRKNPIEYKVKGPRTIKLFVRIPDSGHGEFTITLDGDKYKDIKFDALKSEKYTISIEDGKARAVSSAHTVKLKLEKGEHIVKITTNRTIYVRSVNLAKSAKAIAPVEFDKSLSLITGDSRTTYYTASKDKPVEFQYDGSGTLIVWTRLAFSEAMKGTQHYTVVVEQEGESTLRMKLESLISETSTWENDGNVLPGKARRFEIKLGKGKHKVVFWSEDTPAPYCAIRFKI